MAKGLTYEELMDYALAHYNTGGDATYECWDRDSYEYYVKEFGPITKRRALSMFRVDYEEERAARWHGGEY